jgi:hypothetical protein
MGDLLGSLIWGAKSGQYCVIGGGSLQPPFERHVPKSSPEDIIPTMQSEPRIPFESRIPSEPRVHSEPMIHSESRIKSDLKITSESKEQFSLRLKFDPGSNFPRSPNGQLHQNIEISSLFAFSFRQAYS